jgi:hypothetical protein
MTESGCESYSRLSTGGRLQRVTFDVEGLNQNVREENERIKRLLQFLQHESNTKKISKGSGSQTPKARPAGTWRTNRTCKLRLFIDRGVL